jgi:hypothetical protein
MRVIPAGEEHLEEISDISIHLSFRREYITGCHLMEVGGKLIVGFAAFEARD